MLNLLFFINGISLALGTLKIGSALNVFGRYGYLGVSMKVIGKPQPWIFREPTTDVFEEIENNVISYPDKDQAIFNGDFHMEFCDDIVQLLEAYFREFRIELMEEPWKAFTASWSNEAIASNFGINITHITDNYCFVLVRLSRNKEYKKLNDEIGLNLKPIENVKELADLVEEGDMQSIGNFVKKYGSHFITSYITGDSIFQVLVYHPPVYYRLKKRLKISGITSLSKSELHALFSPWYADYVGPILSASGNTTVTEWAKSVLRSRSFLYPYSSLIKLYGNENLLRALDKKLGNSALLSLDLKTLAPVFEDGQQNWFIEVISNIIKLWESNMWILF